jgi:hypothetical protein
MICPAATGPLASAVVAPGLAEAQDLIVDSDRAALEQGREVTALWESDSLVDKQERQGSGREAIEALDLSRWQKNH